MRVRRGVLASAELPLTRDGLLTHLVRGRVRVEARVRARVRVRVRAVRVVRVRARVRARVSRAAPPPASFARHSEADAEGAAP